MFSFIRFRSAFRIDEQRWWTFASLILVIPTGFYTKFYDGPAADWVNDSLGGVFYEIFWCLVVFLLFPTMRTWMIAIGVLMVTCVLEFAQLWHPPALTLIRSHFLGETLLGTAFSWLDSPYYLGGTAIGWAWISWLRNRFTPQAEWKTTLQMVDNTNSQADPMYPREKNHRTVPI
jgi:hypothetical protein